MSYVKLWDRIRTSSCPCWNKAIKMNLCMLLQYAPTLCVCSPTIKSFAVKFTTASLLKKEKESWEEILMRKFWPLKPVLHTTSLAGFNIVDKNLFKQHFWYIHLLIWFVYNRKSESIYLRSTEPHDIYGVSVLASVPVKTHNLLTVKAIPKIIPTTIMTCYNHVHSFMTITNCKRLMIIH